MGGMKQTTNKTLAGIDEKKIQRQQTSINAKMELSFERNPENTNKNQCKRAKS